LFVPARERLIVALDVPALSEAQRVLGELAPIVTWFKVGSELFTAAGPAAVEAVLARGRRVFLDLKFHDIPRTVAAAVAAAARLGVAMLNVHVAAGEDVLRAAVAAVVSGDPRSHPLLLGVTRLTSLDGGSDMVTQVVDAAERAQRCGLDGVIASPREVAAIKAACGSQFIVVTPGIRPAGFAGGDQRRTATPADAVRAGANYLVVGRPVLEASNPQAALRAILADIDAAIGQERGPDSPVRPQRR